jgi:hypothetical protein
LSTLIIRIWNHCYTLWESRNKDKHGHDTKTKRAVLLAQVQRRMAVMYELKNRCFPSGRSIEIIQISDPIALDRNPQ